MINKRKFCISNDKKVMRKIGKHWVVLSAVMLGLLGLGGATAVHATHASASNQIIHLTKKGKNSYDNIIKEQDLSITKGLGKDVNSKVQSAPSSYDNHFHISAGGEDAEYPWANFDSGSPEHNGNGTYFNPDYRYDHYDIDMYHSNLAQDQLQDDSGYNNVMKVNLPSSQHEANSTPIIISYPQSAKLHGYGKVDVTLEMTGFKYYKPWRGDRSIIFSHNLHNGFRFNGVTNMSVHYIFSKNGQAVSTSHEYLQANHLDGLASYGWHPAGYAGSHAVQDWRNNEAWVATRRHDYTAQFADSSNVTKYLFPYTDIGLIHHSAMPTESNGDALGGLYSTFYTHDHDHSILFNLSGQSDPEFNVGSAVGYGIVRPSSKIYVPKQHPKIHKTSNHKYLAPKPTKKQPWGEDYDYTLTGKLPSSPGSNTKFIITDKMPKGVQFNGTITNDLGQSANDLTHGSNNDIDYTVPENVLKQDAGKRYEIKVPVHYTGRVPKTKEHVINNTAYETIDSQKAPSNVVHNYIKRTNQPPRKHHLTPPDTTPKPIDKYSIETEEGSYNRRHDILRHYGEDFNYHVRGLMPTRTSKNSVRQGENTVHQGKSGNWYGHYSNSYYYDGHTGDHYTLTDTLPKEVTVNGNAGHLFGAGASITTNSNGQEVLTWRLNNKQMDKASDEHYNIKLPVKVTYLPKVQTHWLNFTNHAKANEDLYGSSSDHDAQTSNKILMLNWTKPKYERFVTDTNPLNDDMPFRWNVRTNMFNFKRYQYKDKGWRHDLPKTPVTFSVTDAKDGKVLYTKTESLYKLISKNRHGHVFVQFKNKLDTKNAETEKDSDGTYVPLKISIDSTDSHQVKFTNQTMYSKGYVSNDHDLTNKSFTKDHGSKAVETAPEQTIKYFGLPMRVLYEQLTASETNGDDLNKPASMETGLGVKNDIKLSYAGFTHPAHYAHHGAIMDFAMPNVWDEKDSDIQYARAQREGRASKQDIDAMDGKMTNASQYDDKNKNDHETWDGYDMTPQDYYNDTLADQMETHHRRFGYRNMADDANGMDMYEHNMPKSLDTMFHWSKADRKSGSKIDRAFEDASHKYIVQDYPGVSHMSYQFYPRVLDRDSGEVQLGSARHSHDKLAENYDSIDSNSIKNVNSHRMYTPYFMPLGHYQVTFVKNRDSNSHEQRLGRNWFNVTIPRDIYAYGHMYLADNSKSEYDDGLALQGIDSGKLAHQTPKGFTHADLNWLKTTGF